jgi:hypothetical protein
MADDLDRYRKYLAIDKDDLDQCLVRQPELYYHVADAYSQAVAERDATKFDIEVAEAEEAQAIRNQAAKNEEKVTESSVKEQLVLSPRLQKLRRTQAAQKEAAEAWMALMDAYKQRSYMLREMVPMYLSRLSTGSVTAPRQAIAETVRRTAGEERMRRRGVS